MLEYKVEMVVEKRGTFIHRVLKALRGSTKQPGFPRGFRTLLANQRTSTECLQ